MISKGPQGICPFKLPVKAVAALVAVLIAAIAGFTGLDLQAADHSASSHSGISQSHSSSSEGTWSESAPAADTYRILDEEPDFGDLDGNLRSFESYSDLDSLGRCGEALACLGLDLMPTGERESLSEIHPSGWHQRFYDFIESSNGALYNRCHLIAYSLAGENKNADNLITGTSQMNETMTIFEDIARNYIQGTGNHVLYRVTPDFQADELVARGVHMEALSVEDGGEGVRFNVYIPNEQEGVEIDYATGKSRAS